MKGCDKVRHNTLFSDIFFKPLVFRSSEKKQLFKVFTLKVLLKNFYSFSKNVTPLVV